LLQYGSAGGDQYGRRLYDDDTRRPVYSSTTERQPGPRLFDDSQPERHVHQLERRVQFEDDAAGKRSQALTADLTRTKYDIGIFAGVFAAMRHIVRSTARVSNA